MGWIECHGGDHSKQSIFFTTRKNTSIDDREEMKKCLDFQDHGLFFLGIQQNLLWLFLLLLIWDEGAAADNKTRHFVFQSSSSCWLLHGNRVWCWLFVFWLWIGRRTNYNLKTTFRIGSNRFEWWCRWWLIGFIFRSCFPLNKTKYIVYHYKKLSSIPFILSKIFSLNPQSSWIPCVFSYCSSAFWLVLQIFDSENSSAVFFVFFWILQNSSHAIFHGFSQILK